MCRGILPANLRFEAGALQTSNSVARRKPAREWKASRRSIKIPEGRFTLFTGKEFPKFGPYVIAAFAVSAVTAGLFVLRGHINAITVAVCFLLAVLFVAAFIGSRPAYLASVLGVLSLNFFFLPPYHTFGIADPQNWIALAAFLITALIAGDLSARVKRRAEEAEAGRREIERLYNQLTEAFERASEAEALKKSETLKSALLDAVTHNLRTPLTSLKAAATTLLSESRNREASVLDLEAQRDLLDVIDNEADRLNRLVENLVRIARIEAGEMELNRRWVSVEEIVTNALQRAARQKADHRFRLDVSETLPSVKVDAVSMTEVVYILLENAMKYSPRGSEIRVTAGLEREGNLRMMVEDQGCGIPPDFRSRVFEKFFRVVRDNTAGSKSGGLGMGLAIARGIVEAHGGTIWVESGSGGNGTRIVFVIPAGTKEAVEATALKEESQA